VLVETYLPGPEFTIAVLGNGPDTRCLPIVEIDFSTLPAGAPPVYGYEAKWLWDTGAGELEIHQCPARIPAELASRIEQVALDAYRALDCRDWCRIDVRLDEYRIPNIVELNPLPGIIPDPRMHSCFPKAAGVAGISYGELIRMVVQIAWRRIRGTDLTLPSTEAAIA
jgi:D-alanine-D-alanine ligase